MASIHKELRVRRDPDNAKAIRDVCRELIVLCRQLNLFSEAIVAIDGAKFNFTDTKLKKRMEQLEERYASLRKSGASVSTRYRT